MASLPDSQELSLLNSIHPVSRETLERLGLYREQLLRWQAKTNLVGPATLTDFWSRHVADSLQCLALYPQTRVWADLGSGGGFPGLAIAIANAGESDKNHHLVESIHKKCAFLRSVVRETGARATVHCERIESVAKHIANLPEKPQIVTARALAPLPRLLALAHPILASGAVGLFHKGREFEAELRECDGLWQFDLVVHKSRIEIGSVLLEVRNLASVGS